MEDEYNLMDELLAACALLGRQIDSKTYIKGDECLDALKDLQQFLHRDDLICDIDQPVSVDHRGRKKKPRKPWELHNALAEWNILQVHILPLLACHAEDDPEVFYECLVVMYLMTQLPPIPTILNDDEKGQIENKMKSYGAALVPALEGLCLYKEQIATSKHVLTIIMKWLMEPLLNGDEAERSENETVILDLALNVIRNLLHVEAPMNANGERYQVPASIKARLQTAQDALLKKFAEENVLEMLVLLAQSVDEEENRTFNLLLLEIFSLLFVREDPSEVHGIAAVMDGKWMSSERRKELIAAVPKSQSVQQRRAKCRIRNSRFSGTFKIETGNGLSFLGATPSARPVAKANKQQAFRKKNLVETVEQRSAVGRNDVLVELDKYAQLFLEVAFNALTGTVSYDISRDNNAVESPDEVNFTCLVSWFMRYHRLKEKSRIASLPKRPKPDKTQESGPQDAMDKKNGAQEGAVVDASATLHDTAEKLLAMIQEGAVEEGKEAEKGEGNEDGAQRADGEIGEKQGEAEVGAGRRGNHDGEPGISDSDITGDQSLTTNTSVEVDHGDADAMVGHSGRWTALPSVVTWNLSGRHALLSAQSCLVAAPRNATEAVVLRGVEGEEDGGGMQKNFEDDRQGLGGEAEAGPKTPEEPPEELPDPYDFNAGVVSAIIDKANLHWISNKVHEALKPQLGRGKPKWNMLPALVALMREMVATIHQLFFSHSKTSKDVAETLLRNLVYEWDFGETLVLLIKEYKPYRNSRQYLCDVVDVTYTLLRVLKTFADENPNLVYLKKRRTRRSKKRVEGKEGEGEWLGGDGSDMEEIEEESMEERPFNFNSFTQRFANFQVVQVYTALLGKYQLNAATTNHQICKMLDLIARKCEMLPLLWQMSIFKVFNSILSDPASEKKEHKETVGFVRWVVREFFTLALQAPCLFAETIAWTKHHNDASLIMRAYKPEERENKGKKSRHKDDDEYLLAQQARCENKWSEEDDLALRELFEQFSGKANAPQIMASLLDGRTPQGIARRLNKLGLFTSRGGDWSEDEFDDEMDDESNSDTLYVCARRLRNTAPLALDWVIECYALACDVRDKTLQAARTPGQDLPEEFFEVQDFALVPVEDAEWEHLVNPATMRLLGAMGCLGPRLLEGHAFWRFAAEALRDDSRTAAVYDELISAQSAEIEVEQAHEDSGSEEETRRVVREEASGSALASPAREQVATQGAGEGYAAQSLSEPSPPTRQKRRIRLQDSDSEDEAMPLSKEGETSMGNMQPGDAASHARVRNAKRVLDDSDDEMSSAPAATDGDMAEIAAKVGSMASKRARLVALDSDSE